MTPVMSSCTRSLLVASALKTILPLEARQNLRSALMNLNAQDKSKLTLSDEERKKLTQFYREDVLKLQDLIQRDLSRWLQ